MKPLAELLAELAESLIGPEMPGISVTGISVTGLDLLVPIETHLRANGELEATLPRGQLATGFDAPLGSMQVQIQRVGDGGAR